MVRGILLVGISSTGPLGIKMNPEVDQILHEIIQQSTLQKIPSKYIVQGKRNHLEQLEIRPHSDGLEIWAQFKEIPNMIQSLSSGEWILIGLLRNPAQIFQMNGTQRALARHQYQGTLFLDRNTRRAVNQVYRHPICD